MSEPKFSKGPWRVFGDDEAPTGCPFIQLARGDCPSKEFRHVAQVMGEGDDGDGNDFYITDEDRANADLIAAAPDLYAIADLISRFNSDEGLSPAALSHLKDMAETASAKARGEQ